MRAVLRQECRPPFHPAGPVFPYAASGYFEGIDSERGTCWRCQDSLSVRECVGLGFTDAAPDHFSMTRIRQRLPLETRHAVFGHLQKLLARHKLLSGRFWGWIPPPWRPTPRSRRSCVGTRGRTTGRCWSVWRRSGIETPIQELLIAFDKKRKGKTLSNADWALQTDEDARIAKMKDGRTQKAYKAEQRWRWRAAR